MNNEHRTTNRTMLLASLTCCLLLSSRASADVPHLIRYQGQAVDSQGVPLEGPYTLTFRLYDAETGGVKRWEEMQANVALQGGQFSVLLGQVTPLTAMDWSAPRWLSVQVGSDPELAPRQRITSVPLAIMAERLSVPVATSTILDDAHNLVPAGAVIIWLGSTCPTGYTRVTALDDKFLVAHANYNPFAGGEHTKNLQHSHGGVTGGHTLTIAEMPRHHHVVSSGGGGSLDMDSVLGSANADEGYTGNDTTDYMGGGGSHNHPIASDLPAALDIRPAFATVLLCQKD